MKEPPKRSQHRLVFVSTLTALGLALASCEGGDTTAPPQQDPDAVSRPSARAASAPALRNPEQGGPREISRQKAERLASLWIKDFAPTNAEGWEEQRGAPVDWEALETCGRAAYVATPFRDPGPNVPVPAKRGVGSWWMVSFCAGAEPQMSVAVSAWNTDLRIEDGALRFPEYSGNHFVPRSIPPETTYDDIFLIPRGRALQMARQATGKKVAGRPELVMQPNVMPQFAHWRVTLASPAKFRVEGRGLVERQEVFIGSHGPRTDGRMAVAARPTYGRRTISLGYYDDDGQHRSTKVEARAGYPLEKQVVQASESETPQ